MIQGQPQYVFPVHALPCCLGRSMIWQVLQELENGSQRRPKEKLYDECGASAAITHINIRE
jgi:hypothetical protein